MRVRETDLSPRIAVNLETSTVQFSHCTCIAGLGETCSHVGAVLFCLMFATMKQDEENNKSVTKKLAYWLLPAPTSNALPPIRLVDTNYTKTRLRKRSYETHLELSLDTDPITYPLHNCQHERAQNVLQSLNIINPDSSILHIVKPFSDAFESKIHKYKFSCKRRMNQILS